MKLNELLKESGVDDTFVYGLKQSDSGQLKIAVNNHSSILLELKQNGLSVKHLNDKQELIRIDRIGEGDLVTLINWYNYQKKSGNEELKF